VRGRDELDVGKERVEVTGDLALPARVEMQVDLVDERDRRLGERVRARGVRVEHATREIDDPRDHASVTETECPHRDPSVGCFDLDVRTRWVGVEASAADVADVG